jgi:ubiquinone/menaquinone biosynthesis C-methylase UbiE
MWTGGSSYESYMGRWSRLVALQFVPWLNVSSESQWLDVGCGTGTLIQTILDTVSPRALLGIDSSERYIEFAHKISRSRV